jgi:hypothetical protein
MTMFQIMYTVMANVPISRTSLILLKADAKNLTPADVRTSLDASDVTGMLGFQR